MGTIDVSGFTLLYEVNSDKNIDITGYDGASSRLIIPDVISIGDVEYRVSGIAKKAFLGCKGLKLVSLPESVISIGDWSFAQCIHLEELAIRGGKESFASIAGRISIGRGAFEDCTKLESICLGYDEPDDLAFLLGSVIWRLPAPYLFNSPSLGNEEWFANWDLKLESYLNLRDDDGYTNQVLCGEEDISYDDIGSIDGEMPGENYAYIMEVKKCKCYLCFLRLMHDMHLSESKRDYFTEYVNRFTIKSKENDSAWQVIRDELGDDVEYFKLYTKITNPDGELIDAMLEDLGDKNAEAKVHLINYKQEMEGASDPFADMFI